MRAYRSQHYTRTRLLNQLGLFQPPTSSGAAAEIHSHHAGVHGAEQDKSLLSKASLKAAYSSSPPSSYRKQHAPQPQPVAQHAQQRSVLRSAVPFQAKLKDHSSSSCRSSASFFERAAQVIAHSPLNANGNSHMETKTERRQIQFNETVLVVPIPSRLQYSNRIKQHIWSNRHELKEMAQRNYAEFEAEGFDWRNVVLEQEMFLDSLNGKLIHPCHLAHAPPQYAKQLAAQNNHQQHHHLFEDEEEDANDCEDEEDYDSDDNDGFMPLQRSASCSSAPHPQHHHDGFAPLQRNRSCSS